AQAGLQPAPAPESEAGLSWVDESRGARVRWLFVWAAGRAAGRNRGAFVLWAIRPGVTLSLFRRSARQQAGICRLLRDPRWVRRRRSTTRAGHLRGVYPLGRHRADRAWNRV